MVIAEAAAAGTPTIIHEDSIGVTSLLSADHEKILNMDMASLRRSTSSVVKMVNDRKHLSKVGQNAQNRAFEWTTEDYGKTLMNEMTEKVAMPY